MLTIIMKIAIALSLYWIILLTVFAVNRMGALKRFRWDALAVNVTLGVLLAATPYILIHVLPYLEGGVGAVAVPSFPPLIVIMPGVSPEIDFLNKYAYLTLSALILLECFGGIFWAWRKSYGKHDRVD